MLQFLLTLSDESDHEKIEHIYDTYHDYMLRFAVSKFHASGRANFRYDAEDAVQNAFVKIVKHINRIDFSRDDQDIKSYCLSILCNEIYNVMEDNRKFFDFNEELYSKNEYNFVEELEMQETYDEVVKAIEALDEKYSSTLYLALCDEMSIKQISKLMGISTKTVYTRLSRGKKLLLDSLKGVIIDG